MSPLITTRAGASANAYGFTGGSKNPPTTISLLTVAGGGGGSGAYNMVNAGNGGSGGSGVVVIQYPNTFDLATSTTGSPTITNSGGNRTYKFTGTGSITF